MYCDNRDVQWDHGVQSPEITSKTIYRNWISVIDFFINPKYLQHSDKTQTTQGKHSPQMLFYYKSRKADTVWDEQQLMQWQNHEFSADGQKPHIGKSGESVKMKERLAK